MKIALLTASCRGGGAERVQITLAKEFAQRGHSVYFVAFEDDGPLRSEIPKDVHKVNFGVSRVMNGILPLVLFLRTEKPDAVIAAMAHVGTVALMAQILARWPGKLLVRVDGSRRYQDQGAFSFKRLMLYMLQKCFLPRAYAVLGVSAVIAEELRDDFSLSNCHIIPNPVAISNEGEGSRTKHPFFDCNKPVIIAIGRLHKEKGFSFLLRVFAILHKTHDANLLILGEGEERQSLEIEIKTLGVEHHVSLPGFVRDPFAYLRRSTVYALSSESESFGLTLVEALSVGIPVVSTDTEGPRDILNDDKLGELVPFGNVEGFAAALGRSLDSSENYREKRISRAADFAPPRIAAQYLRLIGNK